MRFDDEYILKTFQERLSLLDDAHRRARGPRARHRIEAKMRELRKEIEQFKERSKVVDIRFARWWKGVEEAFDRLAGETEKKS